MADVSESIRDDRAGSSSTVDGGLNADVPTWHEEVGRAALLSSREAEVFFLLGTGKSNRAIAWKLQITERTVNAHVAQIMAKLRVESRLQAGLASYAYQLTLQCRVPWQQGSGH